MQSDFNSNYAVDRMTDESLIDNALPEEVVELFYKDDVLVNFAEQSIDFGGGVYGITCRAILNACDSNSNKLLELLQIRKTKENKSLCSSIIAVCKQQISSSAYLL